MKMLHYLYLYLCPLCSPYVKNISMVQLQSLYLRYHLAMTPSGLFSEGLLFSGCWKGDSKQTTQLRRMIKNHRECMKMCLILQLKSVRNMKVINMQPILCRTSFSSSFSSFYYIYFLCFVFGTYFNGHFCTDLQTPTQFWRLGAKHV